MSFPAGKFTDYDACHYGPSSAAQDWVAMIKGQIDGMMRSRNIAGGNTTQSRSACAKIENPADRTGFFRREFGDNEHAEIAIAERVYKVKLSELG